MILELKVDIVLSLKVVVTVQCTSRLFWVVDNSQFQAGIGPRLARKGKFQCTQTSGNVDREILPFATQNFSLHVFKIATRLSGKN